MNKSIFKEHNDIPNVDFATVIAVAIHDMKNSLSLLMQSIEQISDNLPTQNSALMEDLTSAHYEAGRMNTALVQILGLYRSSIDALPINIDEIFVSDLINEIVDSNANYIKQKNIEVNAQIDEDLSWFFDRELIYLMMYDVVINAMRYGCKHLNIDASIEDQYLKITISDDGPGYPESMLKTSKLALGDHAISQGRTGLGLFFARLIANTHSNNSLNGRIELSNAESGGSVFVLYLP
ncbi:MAG: HAMP domain-containing sensor histidine kinase [Pseudomonadota bacterium]